MSDYKHPDGTERHPLNREAKWVDDFNKENPDTVYRRMQKEAALSNPINMNKYQNIVKTITREDSVRKAEAHVPKKSPGEVETINFGGIKDNRKDRKFFKIYTGE